MIRHVLAAGSLLAVVIGLGACAKESGPEPTAATPAAQPAPSSTEPTGATSTTTQPSAGAMGTGGMGTGPAGGMRMMQPTECPMTVAGTSVQATPTSDGVDMTFTTTGDVPEVRRRARGMADRMGMGTMPMGGMMMGMPQMRAQVENVPGGARVHVMPSDPARLDEMRQHMQQQAQMMMQQHDCPMAARDAGGP